MWEERYRGSQDYLFGKAPAQFLVENPGWIKPGQSVLSVADGEGRNSTWLAAQGADVQSFDMSETAVARAQKLAEEQGVSVASHLCDWQDWDWKGAQFDLVVAIFIQFAGPSERGAQFADLKQAVRPGGVLMLHGYRPEQVALGTGGPPFVENMYTAEILGKYFGNWKVERLAAYERDVQEGRGHSGKSALIDLIVRRPKA